MTAVLAIISVLALSAILQPATAIAGAFCMFGIEQWTQASDPYFLTRSGRPLINTLIGAVVALGVIRKIFGRQGIVRGYPVVGLFVMALFFYALASTLWAPNPARSLSAFLGQAPYIITIVFLCPLLCSSTRDFEWMLVATFVLGTVVVFLLMFTVEWKGRGVVLPGWETTGNPLATASVGGTIAIIAAFLSWHRFKFLNILKWLVVVLGLFLVVKSGSRGQTFAAIIAIFACSPMAHRLDNFKAYGVFGFVIVCLIAAASWGLDLYLAESERWDDDAMDQATGTRLHRALKILEHWFTTPATIFFGLGSSASNDLIGIYSHVVPAEILAEEGIVGFLIYSGIVLTCLKNGLASFFLVRYNRAQRTHLAILCALFMFYFVVSLKEGNLLSNSQLFMVAVLVGKYQNAVSRYHRLAQATERDHSSASTTNLR